MSLCEVDYGQKVPRGLFDDRMGAGVNALVSSGSRKTSVQENYQGVSFSNPLEMDFIPSHVVSEDMGGVLFIGSPLASLTIHCSVASCPLLSSDFVFTPSIVSTNISTSSEGRSIRYALRSREISVEGSGGKGFPKLSSRVVGKGRA